MIIVTRFHWKYKAHTVDKVFFIKQQPCLRYRYSLNKKAMINFGCARPIPNCGWIGTPFPAILAWLEHLRSRYVVEQCGELVLQD